MSTSDAARIHDRGYRSYDGTRTGVPGAVFSLYRYTFARVLGMHRPARAKVLPLAAAALAYLPGIAFVGLGVFLPKRIARSAFPAYAEYYGFIVSAILLFVAFSAPEALCPDRRHGVLGVYLASPLDRVTYLIAKFGAVISAISLVTLVPPVILAVARSLQGYGPGPEDLAVLLARIVVSGAMLALFYGTFAMAASSLTDRKGFASTGIVLAVIVSSAVAGVLRGRRGEDWPVILDLFVLPYEAVQRIYGRPGDFPGMTSLWLALAIVAWIAAGVAIVAVQYERLEVTK